MEAKRADRVLVGLALLGLVLWFVCGALVLFADSAVLSLGLVGFVQGGLRQLLGGVGTGFGLLLGMLSTCCLILYLELVYVVAMVKPI